LKKKPLSAIFCVNPKVKVPVSCGIATLKNRLFLMPPAGLLLSPFAGGLKPQELIC